MLALQEPQKAQNIFHLLDKQKYGSTCEQKNNLKDCAENLIDYRRTNNFACGNCTKTIYKGQNRILAFDVNKHFAAAYCWNKSLKLWNLDTGECLWTVESLNPVYGKILVKIVEDKVVLAGFEGLDEHTTTRIFDLENGYKNVSFTTWNEESKRLCAQACVIGNRIFTLDHSNISVWNLKAKCIQHITLNNDFPASIFVGQGNFLVYISKKDLTIHDLEKRENLKIDLNSIGENITISCACLDVNRLICGITKPKNKLPTKPSCCVIDLSSGKILQHYPSIDQDGNRTHFPKFNHIKKIIADKDWAYLTNDHDEIIAVHFAGNTHHLLGSHKNYIHTQALNGDGVLITASASTRSRMAELKFWSTKTLKLLAAKEFNSLNGIAFDFRKVFASVERSLVQWDYQVEHEGEKLSEHSAAEIEIDPGAQNCVVQ